MMRIVLFQVGEQRYALDLVYSRGIEQPSVVMPIPQAPENITGVINLRGELFPVYSLRKRFGLPTVPATADTKFLIGYTNGIPIAYEVDKVLEIEEIEDDQMAPPPVMVRNAETSYIDSVVFAKKGMAILLSMVGMLSPEERKLLDDALNQMRNQAAEKAEEAKKTEEVETAAESDHTATSKPAAEPDSPSTSEPAAEPDSPSTSEPAAESDGPSTSEPATEPDATETSTEIETS